MLTLLGIGLFTYFLLAVGVDEVLDGVEKFGFDGFAVIVALFFTRIVARAYAWKLSVHAPYALRLRDTIPAVIIGEAMSVTVPLGILASGTTKAIAVRKHIPLVGGLSSVATENLFYSFTTGLFLIIGAAVFVRRFAVEPGLIATLDGLIGTLAFLILLGLIMVLRQWHFLSETCEWIYRKGYFRALLEDVRLDLRLFENLIYGFYRNYPKRFLPICGIETAYHLLGIAEVWYILYRLGAGSSLMNAFLLESVSRLITILFKLVPFMVGVDEAGAQFVGQTVALAAGIGVTLAVIRKGRILFWAIVGWILIIKRGISFELAHEPEPSPNQI
ncbi:MAG: flippase-like domain-containing protein [Acidobacteria bacterium]|nr:flippase-like domain-containing protein [Acidobacteriota bacterium]